MNQSIAVLPSGLSLPSSSSSSTATRFLKLPHPRTGLPALYLPSSTPGGVHHAERGVDQDQDADKHGAGEDVLLEVQAINAMGDRQRSWFVNDDAVLGDGKMLLLTPFDPLFLLVPILLAVGQATVSGTRRSVPYEDVFESAGPLLQSRSSFSAASSSSSSSASKNTQETPRTRAKRLRLDESGARADVGGSGDAEKEGAELGALYDDLVAFGALGCVRRAMDRICEVQEIAPDLSTYRLDEGKLYQILKDKVDRLAGREVFDKAPSLARLLAKEGVGDGEGVGEEVQREARQKASLDLLSGYLPKEVSSTLRASYTFPSLAGYLANTSSSSVLSVDYLPGLSNSASASSSSTSLHTESTFGMSRKTSSDGGKSPSPSASLFGAPGTGGAKGKKKPGHESNGVKALKKVSTRGMSPLTSFFAKKSPSPNPLSSTPETLNNPAGS